MANKYEVPADKLTWLCDLSLLPFDCTADMTPLVDFIGQERAIRAIQFGLGVDKPGFNIFVTGLTGTGKTSIIKAFLKKITTERIPADAESAFPEDWCYVYNFNDPDRPQILKIRRGWGKTLKADMDQLVQTLQREAKRMFESDEFAQQRQSMIEELQKKQQQMMQGLMEEAARSGFTLRMGPSGMVLLPTKNGKPMEEADYLALSTSEKKQMEEKRGEIEGKVEATLREGKKLEREITEKLATVETQAGEYLVRIPLAEIKEKYHDHPKILAYLDAGAGSYSKELESFQGDRSQPRDGSDGGGLASGRTFHGSFFTLSGECFRRQQ